MAVISVRPPVQRITATCGISISFTYNRRDRAVSCTHSPFHPGGNCKTGGFQRGDVADIDFRSVCTIKFRRQGIHAALRIGHAARSRAVVAVTG